MRKPHSHRYMFGLMVALTMFGASLTASFAQIPTNFAAPDFQGLWSRTDFLVAAGDGTVARSYLWGPTPLTAGMAEPYVESPGGKRLVQYFDKSRMEITHPNANRRSAYYVTNGLLVVELMSGQVQIGDNRFETRQPAVIGVAGDADDTIGPTYATFTAVPALVAPVAEETTLITHSLDRTGHTVSSDNASYGKYGIKNAAYESNTHHNIAKPFWDYLNQTCPLLFGTGEVFTGRLFDPLYYDTDLPISEAWWAKVKVGGVVKDVLIQAFERRVLTYTPSNPAAYQVEMGNVGQHYYRWRYGK